MAVKRRVSAAVSILGLVLGAGGLSLSSASLASADSTSIYGCAFEETATTWTLQSNCNSTGQINIPTGITLDGGDFTIAPTFQRNPDYDIWGAIEISSALNVTIHNLTIDASISNNLHGVNIYKSTNVKIDRLTVRNMGHTGINVNSSTVSLSDVTTSNNGWDGIDVDQKASPPATLNIVGPMTQTDAVQILVDDTRKAVTVNDVRHQYAVMHFTKDGAPAAAYVLYRTLRESCQNGGWKLGLNSIQSFKNQGECVAHFESDGKSDPGNKKN